MSSAGRGLNYVCPTCDVKMRIKQVDWGFTLGGLMRRRVCPKCNHRITTVETIVTETYVNGKGYVKTKT